MIILIGKSLYFSRMDSLLTDTHTHTHTQVGYSYHLGWHSIGVMAFTVQTVFSIPLGFSNPTPNPYPSQKTFCIFTFSEHFILYDL